MTFFDSFGNAPGLQPLQKAFPGTQKPLLDYVDSLLRGSDNPFTESERELIGAYVSGINGCSFCYGIHTATAEAFGLTEGLVGELLDDLEAADIDDRMKTVLRYAEKLTTSPAEVTQADADRFYQEGLGEDELYYTASIASLFNLMNRLVEGTGVRCMKCEAFFQQASMRLKSQGYLTEEDAPYCEEDHDHSLHEHNH